MYQGKLQSDCLSVSNEKLHFVHKDFIYHTNGAVTVICRKLHIRSITGNGSR